MTKLKRAWIYCLHKAWLLLVISILLLAILVTALRIGLPYAQSYKSNLEQFIASQYGAKVQIGQLSAGWQSLGPALLLQQVQVKNNAGEPLLQIAETRVRLDFWASLTSLQLIAEHFELSGLHYQLDSHNLLQPSKPDENAEPLLNAVEQLLFQQLKNFTLVESEIQLVSEYTPPITIAIKKLAWHNAAKHHQGAGEVAIAGVTSNTINFILDLHGDSLNDSRGMLYLSSQDLDVLPWFETVLPQSKKLSRADINFQAWGDIRQGKLQQMQLALADNKLVWQQDKQTEQLNLGKGQLIWRPDANGWQLLSSELSLSTGPHHWQDLQFQLSRQQGGYTASVQQLRLAAAVPLAQLFAEEVNVLQGVLAYQADARLTQLALRLDQQQWFLSGDFIDLSSKPVADVPGVSQLSGHFTASADYIRLDLLGQDGELNWGGAFSRNTPYQSLSGQLDVLQQNGEWLVQVPRLALRHPDIQLDAQLSIQLSARPQMSLLAELRGVPVADAAFYFPTLHMPQSVIDYLVPALVSGQVPLARTLWHGEFQAFPFAEHNGIFQALAWVHDSEFSFDPSWPVIKGMQAELLFENAGMLIQSQAGTLFDLPLDGGVTAKIPDLFQADMLDITIQRQTQAELVKGLMLASPLSGSVGSTLDYLGVSGLVDARVQLLIPLDEGTAKASGDVDFIQGQLHIKAPAVAVEQLSGRLHFDNEQISADQLSFISSGVALTARLQGQQLSDYYQVQLKAKGEHAVDQLLGLISADWQQLGQGQANFDWDLLIQLPESGFRYQSSTLVDLAATELALPAPYGKIAADGATLLLESKGDQQGSSIELKYGDQLRLQAHLDQASNKIDAALLSLGPASAQLRPGFYIEADLAKADFSPWLALIQHQLQQQPAVDPASSLFPPLTKVTAKVGELHLFNDVYLHQVRFELLPDTEQWQLDLHATEAEGRILFAEDLQQQGIKADFARLRLIFADQEAAKLRATELKAQQLLDPDSVSKPDYAALEAASFASLQPMNWLLKLPPIQFQCKQCQIGDYPLGQLSGNSKADGQRWLLQALDSQYQGHHWQVSGYWQANDGIGLTELSGKLDSPAFGQLMQDYQLNSSMTGSKAKLQLERIRWQGAPFQFNFHSLAGKLDWQLGEGSLVEVSDGGTRLFSLLSLDSLLRKLRLDFRDVFSKGFFYNKMTGSMQIRQGVATTPQMQVDGVAGDISMSGDTDLRSRQLNYQMSFAPKVTSSIPVILAWMVNPVSGVAAYALDEMFNSAEVISKINFSVTGDLDMPVVTELKRDSKTVPLPEGAVKKPEGADPLQPQASPLLPPINQLPAERPMQEAPPIDDAAGH